MCFARRVRCFSCGAEKPLRPRLALRDAGGGESNRPVLMVKGLRESTEEGTLLDVFGVFGMLREIRLVRERQTKASRGFAFVEFHAMESAK